MLSREFGQALREVRMQLSALAQENKELRQLIDDLTKKVESSEEQTIKQQSLKIRQAAALGDEATLAALNTSGISPVDAELIRLSLPAKQEQPVPPLVVNTQLVANMVAAAKSRQVPLLPQEVPLRQNPNISRMQAQLKANNVAMAAEAELRKQRQLDSDAAQRKDYLSKNNAMLTRSSTWMMDGDF